MVSANERARESMIKDEIYKCFEGNHTTGPAVCRLHLVSGKQCNAKYTKFHKNNLKKHLIDNHNQTYTEILAKLEQKLANSSLQPYLPPNSLDGANREIRGFMSKNCFESHLVRLFASDGRVFSMLDNESFRSLMAIFFKAFGKTYTRNNIKDLIKAEAEKQRQFLKLELKDRLLSLKFDGCTKRRRHFFGINAQYIFNDKVKIVNLSTLEYKTSSTSDNLKREIVKILSRFSIELSQVVSATVDNAANMILSVDKLNLDFFLSSDCLSEITSLVGIDVVENLVGMSTDESGERTKQDGISFNNACKDFLLLLKENAFQGIFTVPCGAHSLQLGVNNFINFCDAPIEAIRKAIKTARIPKYANRLEQMKLNAPIIDNATRWFSTFKMIESFILLQEFFESEVDTEPDFYFESENFLQIKRLYESLVPAYTLNLSLQSETITYSEFHIKYRFMLQSISIVNNEYSTELTTCISEKCEYLMHSDLMFVSLFLNPTTIGVLTEEELSQAKNTIKNLHLRYNAFLKKKTTDQSQAPSVSQEVFESEYQKFIVEQYKTKNTPPMGFTFDEQLARYQIVAREMAEHDLIVFWKNLKKECPELGLLVESIMGVPCTQVSVERGFSDLAFVYSPLRSKLRSDMIEDILFLRSNSRFNKN